MAPDAWFWAHDARPDQLDALTTPGQRLVRLSCYGSGRYAALFHSGASSAYELGLDAAAVSARKDVTAITVDDRARFSAVIDPLVATIVHVDLDEDEARAVTGDIMDVATYTLRGARRYALVLRESSTPSVLLANLAMADLRSELDRLEMAVVRLRAHSDPGRYTAVLARTTSTYYADLDADGVARQLERHRADPVDLDAVQTAAGVRFTVVMR
jgi:hypothetical protein